MLDSRLKSIIDVSLRIVAVGIMKHLLLAIAVILASATAGAQDELRLGSSSQSWDVFLHQGDENQAETTVTFIDLLTGETTAIVTTGERHTLVGDAVLYLNSAERRIKLVKPDGVIRDHPYLLFGNGDFSIDWAVSADGLRIAWAISRKSDDSRLTTSLMVADASGTDVRELLVYGPRHGIRLAPVAFAGTLDKLYVEVLAETTDSDSAYTRRSELFALDFSAENVAALALFGDRACFCAVGFGHDRMLRLVPRTDAQGIELEIHDLPTGTIRIAPPVSLGDYDKGGNILVSPDGTMAVYALSRIDAFAPEGEAINSVIVLADLQNARQMVVNYPMDAIVSPDKWTEDNTAVLLTLEGRSGTWKMQLDDGETVKVSDSAFLGTIGGKARN